MRFLLRLILSLSLVVLWFGGNNSRCDKATIGRSKSYEQSFSISERGYTKESMQLPSALRIVSFETVQSSSTNSFKNNSNSHLYQLGTNLRGSWLKPIKSSYILSFYADPTPRQVMEMFCRLII